MARVINVNVVRINIITQGLFFTKSNKSSFILDFCSGFGTIRSLVVIKVMSNIIVPIIASQVITISIQIALSPSPA